MGKNNYIENLSFDIVSGEHVFSSRFEQRQKRIIEKVRNCEQSQSHRTWKSIAATFVIVLTLAGGAVAASELFKVENMLVEKGNASEENSITKQDVSEEQKEASHNVIALGIPESAEWKAIQEWKQFCDKYERSYEYEEAILKADENLKNGVETNEFVQYPAWYGIYTQEMADKLEELCEKYSLELPMKEIEITSYNELLEEMGMESFLTSETGVEECYVYADGGWSGYFDLMNKGSNAIGEWADIYVNYQGYLLPATQDLGGLSDYEEWDYTNQNGEITNIVINNITNKSYIFYL